MTEKAAAAPEPVAWMYQNKETGGVIPLMQRIKSDERYVETPLYTHPDERVAMPCGHPTSMLLKSAETGNSLYCEYCEWLAGYCDAAKEK